MAARPARSSNTVTERGAAGRIDPALIEPTLKRIRGERTNSIGGPPRDRLRRAAQSAVPYRSGVAGPFQRHALHRPRCGARNPGARGVLQHRRRLRRAGRRGCGRRRGARAAALRIRFRRCACSNSGANRASKFTSSCWRANGPGAAMRKCAPACCAFGKSCRIACAAASRRRACCPACSACAAARRSCTGSS